MDLHYDFIGSVKLDSVLQLKNYIEHQESPIKHLHLNINSLGGDLIPAIVAYNFLKNQSFEITTHNLAEVCSAAILIYLAGSERTCGEHSKFIMHSIKFTVNGSLSYVQFQEYIQSLETDIKNYASIVNKETDSLKGIYDVETCLKSSSIVLDSLSALKCSVATRMI